MEGKAEQALRNKRSELDQGAKSSPPRLTDVFVAEVRNFLEDGSDEVGKTLDETISLSLEAGIPREHLCSCLAQMKEVGSITLEQQNKLLERIPSEQKK
jgi:hypothetical protein